MQNHGLIDRISWSQPDNYFVDLPFLRHLYIQKPTHCFWLTRKRWEFGDSDKLFLMIQYIQAKNLDPETYLSTAQSEGKPFTLDYYTLFRKKT